MLWNAYFRLNVLVAVLVLNALVQESHFWKENVIFNLI